MQTRVGQRGRSAISVVALIAGLAAAPTSAAAGNTWSVAAANVQAPGYQTATVLPDGRVLATGGQGAKAELFDPATGRWTAAASMNRARKWATATLLSDGKVLVAGGADGTARLDSAEVYDPAANLWTPTGRMATARLAHTATLLSDGKVLVAGGSVAENNYPTATARAELFDPATGRFSETGSMTTARYWFTATPLLDGTVLVADSGPADIYDPATGQFTPTAPLPRDDHSVATVRLHDGRVLSIGGSHGLTTAAVIYAPATRSWQPAASLNWGRFYAPFSAVALADGRVLVVGGSEYLKLAETWDPATGVWTNTGQLANARSNNFGLVRLGDGRVLVDGGAVRDVWCDNEGGGCFFGPLHPAEIYTP